MADLTVAIEIAAKDLASGQIKGVESALGGLSGAASGVIGALSGIGLAANGLSTLGNAFASLGQDAAEAQRIQAQTNAVIESTQGVAGMSADAVDDLANSLSRVTPFEDETVKSAENMLLTFTNIGQNVFPQATETVLDMAQALKEGPQDAAIQLGKALNDPIQGVTALRRVGVQLSDDQQKQVKAFMDVNDVASAQGVILSELSKEFGGSARAAGQTFSGQMKILETQIGNLKEAAFTPLLGVVGNLAGALTSFVSDDDFLAWVGNVSTMVGGILTQAFDVFGNVLTGLRGLFLAFTVDAGGMGIVLDSIRKIFGDTVADAIEPLVQSFMGAIPAIKDFAEVIVDRFSILGKLVSQVFTGDFHAAFETLQGDLLQNTLQIVSQLGDWAKAFLSWVGPLIPPLLKQLQELGMQINTWLVRDALPAIVEQLGEWAGAFVDWVGPQIDPLLHELGGLVTDMTGWLVDTALPQLVENLTKWGIAFVEWVAPRIPPLLVELGKLLLELGNWAVTTALPSIVDHLVKWGEAFIAWVVPQIPPLLGELASLLGSLTNWVATEALPKIIGSLAGWGIAFVRWVADALPNLPGELEKISQAIVDWVSGPGRAQASAAAAEIGQAMIAGLGTAIENGIGSLTANAQKMITSTVQAMKDAAAIHSPSQLVYEQVGIPMVQGITSAFSAAGASIGGAVTDAVSTGLSAVRAVDVPAQFGSAIRAMGFNEATIESICGPIAATGIANALGKAVSLVDVEKISEQIGAFVPGQGTQGTSAFEKILGALGIDSRTASFQDAVNAAMQGIPVAISTPLHYFLAQGFNQATQTFDVGQTGLALKNGAEQMSKAMIEGLAGAATFIIPSVDSARTSLVNLGNTAAAIAGPISDLGTIVADTAKFSDEQVETYASKMHETWDVARFVLESYGDSVGQVLGNIAPTKVQQYDQVVERFADQHKMTWDQARQWLDQYGVASGQVLGEGGQVPSNLSTTSTALQTATAYAGGLANSLSAIPPDVTTHINTIISTTGVGGGGGSGSSSKGGGTDVSGHSYDLSTDAGRNQLIADAANNVIPSGPGGSTIARILEKAGSPSFDMGGLVPGPLGSPVAAVVHGGEYVVPTGGMHSLNEDRLASKIAAALAAALGPTTIQIDGRAVAQVVRRANRQFDATTVLGGVGGF